MAATQSSSLTKDAKSLPTTSSAAEIEMEKYMTLSLPKLVEEFLALAPKKDTKLEGEALSQFDAAFTAMITRLHVNKLEEISEADSKALASIRGGVELDIDKGQHSFAHHLFLCLIYKKNDVDGKKLGRVQSSSHFDTHLNALPEKNNFCILYQGILHYSDKLYYLAWNSFLSLTEQNLRLASLYKAYYPHHYLIWGENKNLPKAKALYEKAAEQGELLSAYSCLQVLIQDKPIKKDEILLALIRFKRLYAMQKSSNPDLEIKGCGIEVTVSQQVHVKVNVEHFNMWLLQEVIKLNGGNNKISDWSVLGYKIYALLTEDKHVLESAIREAINSYQARKIDKEHDYTNAELERHRQMLEAANLLLTSIDGAKSPSDILNALEVFANIDSGRASEHSMKFLIMNNLLKFYAGELYEKAKPNWAHTRAKFSSGLKWMVELGRKFNDDYLAHLQKQTEFEKQFVTVPTKVEKTAATAAVTGVKPLVDVKDVKSQPTTVTSTATVYYSMQQNAAAPIQIESVGAIRTESADTKFEPAENDKPKFPAWSDKPFSAATEWASIFPSFTKEEQEAFNQKRDAAILARIAKLDLDPVQVATASKKVAIIL